MKKLVAACSILISIFCKAQDIFQLQDPGNSFLILKEGWTYKMGDQAQASLTDYNDPGWKPIRPGADIHDSIAAEAKTGIGWMRMRFRVGEDARKQQLSLMVRQWERCLLFNYLILYKK